MKAGVPLGDGEEFLKVFDVPFAADCSKAEEDVGCKNMRGTALGRGLGFTLGLVTNLLGLIVRRGSVTRRDCIAGQGYSARRGCIAGRGYITG